MKTKTGHEEHAYRLTRRSLLQTGAVLGVLAATPRPPLNPLEASDALAAPVVLDLTDRFVDLVLQLESSAFRVLPKILRNLLKIVGKAERDLTRKDLSPGILLSKGVIDVFSKGGNPILACLAAWNCLSPETRDAVLSAASAILDDLAVAIAALRVNAEKLDESIRLSPFGEPVGDSLGRLADVGDTIGGKIGEFGEAIRINVPAVDAATGTTFKAAGIIVGSPFLALKLISALLPF